MPSSSSSSWSSNWQGFSSSYRIISYERRTSQPYKNRCPSDAMNKIVMWYLSWKTLHTAYKRLFDYFWRKNCPGIKNLFYNLFPCWCQPIITLFYAIGFKSLISWNVRRLKILFAPARYNNSINFLRS